MGNGLIEYTPSADLELIPEVTARDRQAAGYLQHSKFPTQIFRVQQFLASVPESAAEAPVFELGCGPGPITPMLARRFQVMSVDFSEASLELNRQALPPAQREAVTYVRADLHALRLARESTSLLMMCDFLQHLGTSEQRNAFLSKAFGWLRPGGYFYLTFFNLNIKNRFRRDVAGAFADGAIKYERLRRADVVRALPAGIVVDDVVPMNIFRNSVPDRFAARVPGAGLFSRMIAIAGRKA